MRLLYCGKSQCPHHNTKIHRERCGRCQYFIDALDSENKVLCRY